MFIIAFCCYPILIFARFSCVLGIKGGGDQDGFRGFPEMYLHLYPILDTGFTEMPHWGFILIQRPTLRSRELLSVNCGENISIKGIRKETD